MNEHIEVEGSHLVIGEIVEYIQPWQSSQHSNAWLLRTEPQRTLWTGKANNKEAVREFIRNDARVLSHLPGVLDFARVKRPSSEPTPIALALLSLFYSLSLGQRRI
jgi:hypothetical protein